MTERLRNLLEIRNQLEQTVSLDAGCAEEIRGWMMEEAVLLETKLAYPKKQVFVLQFSVGEQDDWRNSVPECGGVSKKSLIGLYDLSFGTRLCEAKSSVLYVLSALPLQMPLPMGRASAFEAAGKQGFVWG